MSLSKDEFESAVTAAVLTNYVSEVEAAINKHLEDHTLDIDNVDTEVQEVVSSSVDSIDTFKSVEKYDVNEEKEFEAEIVISATVEFEDYAYEHEFSDTHQFLFSIDIDGELDEHGNITSLNIGEISQL